MRKIFAVCIAVALFTFTAAAGVFISVDVSCNTLTSIYTNTGSGVANITVQATDKCKGADSELQLVDPAGAISLHFIIKDKTTKAFMIAVPSGQSVNLVCNGESGGCSYSLSVP
jgi:hypothetical protein